MNKNIVSLSITLTVLTVLLLVLAIFPLLKRIKQESENLISQKRLLVELESKAENLKKFQDIHETYQVNLDKIDELFINAEEPIEFIKFLEQEAANTHISIEIAPVSVQADKTDLWPSTSFRLIVDGYFPYFLRFLEKIESGPYLASLSNLDIKRLAKDTNGDISASFLIKVYTNGHE